MSIVVFAYSQIGHDCLKDLLELGASVTAVYTHEDSVGETIWFDSVADLAQKNNIPVYTPKKLEAADVVRIQAFQPDLIFSFYYRNLIPEAILSAARLGAFNMHGSWLPYYRGCAPVNWAILKGEKQTGATLHHMISAPDAGDIVDQEAVRIYDNATAGAVMTLVGKAARKIINRKWTALKNGKAPRVVQDLTKGAYYGRRTPEDGRIDWKQTAWDIHNLIRALQPFPQYPAAFDERAGKRILVMASCVPHDPTKHPALLPGTTVVQTENEWIVACGFYGTERITITAWQDAGS